MAGATRQPDSLVRNAREHDEGVQSEFRGGGAHVPEGRPHALAFATHAFCGHGGLGVTEALGKRTTTTTTNSYTKRPTPPPPPSAAAEATNNLIFQTVTVSSPTTSTLSLTTNATVPHTRTHHTLNKERERVVSGVEQHAEHVAGLELATVAPHAAPVAGAAVAIEHPALPMSRSAQPMGGGDGANGEERVRDAHATGHQKPHGKMGLESMN